MNLLLRSAKIIDPTSPHHTQLKDILIERGKISRIGAKIKNSKNYKELKGDNLFVSPGWIDIFSFLGDPGYEYKEDINSGAKAAAAGGFTAVCCVPNTHPPLHSKSEIEYVINKGRGNIVDVYPIGAVSKDCEGKEITEIYDMNQAGAVAFSDGIKSAVNPGLMLRGLLYVKPFNGLIISQPDETSIRDGGVVNEGAISTALGLTGIPSVSEELVLLRDIYMAEYTDSRVHFAYVSSAESLNLIRKAKAKGLKVTCSVAAYNLLLEDGALSDYDTNYKLLPPLKNKKDMEALVEGLMDDTIDAISSLHNPQDIESKRVEFDYAEFGMLGLQTAYPVVNTAVGKKLKEEKIVQKMAITPRELLGLSVPTIKKGNEANLTIFDNKAKWIFEENDIQSKSRNTPFVGKEFTGKVIGIVNNNQLHLGSYE